MESEPCFVKIGWKEGGVREKFKTRQGLPHRTILYHQERREVIGGKEGAWSRRCQWGDVRQLREKIKSMQIFLEVNSDVWCNMV